LRQAKDLKSEMAQAMRDIKMINKELEDINKKKKTAERPSTNQVDLKNNNLLLNTENEIYDDDDYEEDQNNMIVDEVYDD
jgi:hypothetical protein